MATRLYFSEKVESREIRFDPPSYVTKWVCEGEFYANTVAAYAQSYTPAVMSHPNGVLFRQDIDVREAGYSLYYITVPYGQRKKENGEYRFEFDTLGGTVRVTGGVHVATYPSGKPSHNGLIGVKGDDVEGIDIVVPAMKVVVHFKHPAGIITPLQIRALSRLAGTVDNAGFFDWAPGETLFLGAQGVEGSTVETEISYHFAMSENLASTSIAGISNVTKAGWDVAWIAWKQDVEANRAAPKADYVNVVRVYKSASLKAILGFG